MKLAKWRFLWFLFISAVNFSHQASTTKLIATKAEISSYDPTMLNVTFKFDARPNDTYSFNFRSEIFVELDAFLVRVGIALQSANGEYDTMLKGSVADICKYYRDNSTNMFLRLFFNGHFGKKFFPSSCPIKPGVYFMEDFQLNDEFLKVRFVESKFLVVVDLCTRVESKLKCFVNLKVYGEIRDKQKREKEVAHKAN